jgi:hypothetical protein
LAHFKNGFGNSGSFLDVGSHCFYIAKPFSEEVTNIFDPLCDGGSSYGESSSLGAMVEVVALGEEEGGDCRCSGYWGIPVRLLLGLFIGPSSAQGGNDDRSYSRRPS